MKKSILRAIALVCLMALTLVGICSCDHEMISDDEEPKERYYYVKLTVKDLGEIVLELDRDAAPITVDNFVSLVEDGFYDGLTFHRVIEGFMVQGGCPEGTGYGNTGKFIKGEFSANGYNNPISHTRGVISMARGGYSNDSASCQFFICVEDYTGLDGQYAAFGHVIEGMEVADAIVDTTAHLATDGNGGVPKASQAVIEKAELLDGYTK